MDDIVTRLRSEASVPKHRGTRLGFAAMDAANEIERLRRALVSTQESVVAYEKLYARGEASNARSRRPAMIDLYRKRPVTVEVMGPLTFDNAVEMQSWCGGMIGSEYGEPVALIIPTLEGKMVASFGDYIIKGVQGEFYPCKPDIFAETYEPVQEARRG